MEHEGILVDRAVLAKLSNEFANGQGKIEAQIHELAGERFNIGSPKQLGDILFGKMGLPGGRKTADGRVEHGFRCAGRSGGAGH